MAVSKPQSSHEITVVWQRNKKYNKINKSVKNCNCCVSVIPRLHDEANMKQT